jgi:hypothetical protein
MASLLFGDEHLSRFFKLRPTQSDVVDVLAVGVLLRFCRHLAFKRDRRGLPSAI